MLRENEAADLVRSYQEKFETPTDPMFWAEGLEEQINELERAAEGLLKEICEVTFCLIGLLNLTGGELTVEQEERIQPLADRIERQALLLEAFSDDTTQQAFARLVKSRMDSIRCPETGKIMAGPNYSCPVLKDLICG